MKFAKELVFQYVFDYGDGKKKAFTIRLDGHTLNYLPDHEVRPTEWARLENHQCENCPLDKIKHPFCPIAQNIVQILDSFDEDYSYEELMITVKTPARDYCARTSLQRGLSAMLGIYMVSSGCPIMANLKPMVRYHLPFATVEETVYRAASTYLLGQYFKYKRGDTPDWDLQELVRIYEEVQKVNVAMAARLRSSHAKDANINALIVLDVFAKELPQNIEHSLENLSYLFEDQF